MERSQMNFHTQQLFNPFVHFKWTILSGVMYYETLIIYIKFSFECLSQQGHKTYVDINCRVELRYRDYSRDRNRERTSFCWLWKWGPKFLLFLVFVAVSFVCIVCVHRHFEACPPRRIQTRRSHLRNLLFMDSFIIKCDLVSGVFHVSSASYFGDMPSDIVSIAVSTGLGVSVLAGILSGVCYLWTQKVQKSRR